MAKRKSIPKRDQVKTEHTWNLEKIFKSDKAWDRAYHQLERMIPGFDGFRGKLGRSAKTLLACFEFETEFGKLGEKLSAYAALKHSEDVANSTYIAMVGRVTHLSMLASEAASFIAPEVQAVPKAKIKQFLQAPQLAPYRFQIEKLLRYRPHVLSEPEERLLAMQGEVAGAASDIFSQLTDADLMFGFVVNEKGEEVELTQSSYRSLLDSPKRSVRKEAFQKFYGEYEAHANTLAATLNSAVLQDVYESRARNFLSPLESALFADNIPAQVYENLIGVVHDNLDTMYRYLALRQRALRLKDLHVYDTYVPFVKQAPVDIPYPEAVDTICEAVQPLGADYVKVLRKGLLEGRWVDRYENKGKRSGAFSYGAYGSPPYILMNYHDDVLDSMFTLAHEAGHSMHSHYSSKSQPFQSSHYTIFVAEVASTFNEQLLGKYLLDQARTKKERARLICKEADEIRGTIFRQTMFAEYEKIIHEIAAEGQPLTLDVFREVYKDLLGEYFGPGFVIDGILDLEGLRIPHFYSAFYVYKYATGLSAAIALAHSVLEGAPGACERYIEFLSAGGSKFPLDLLRGAGVDLAKPEPVEKAMLRFKELVGELETLI